MNNEPIFVVEMGEGTDTVPYLPNTTLGGLISGRDVNKNVTIKVNNVVKTNDYVLQPGDRVDLIPNVEAGTN